MFLNRSALADRVAEAVALPVVESFHNGSVLLQRRFAPCLRLRPQHARAGYRLRKFPSRTALSLSTRARVRGAWWQLSTKLSAVVSTRARARGNLASVEARSVRAIPARAWETRLLLETGEFYPVGSGELFR